MTYLQYRGYQGTIEPQLKDGTLQGRVAFVRTSITYQAETLPQLVAAFESALDHYLNHCEKNGLTPEKPFKGSFNVRTGPELHRRAAMAAGDRSLNAFICEAISEKLEREENGMG